MAKQDFSELIEYLDKKFLSIDNRFTSVDYRLTGLEHGFGELRSEFRDLQTAVDAYAHKADIYFQEMVALSNKVDRLKRWLLQLAKKAGVKLEY